MWEAVRAGIDDYRTTQPLRQRIAAAKASTRPAARTAAVEAERTLASVMGRIGWRWQALQREERSPPPAPAALWEWRWRIAQEIVKLQRLDGTGPGALPAAPRVSPFDFRWDDPAQSLLDRKSGGGRILDK